MLALSRMKGEYLVFRFGDRLFAVAALEETFRVACEFMVQAEDAGSACAAPNFRLRGQRRPAICLSFGGRPVCYFGVMKSGPGKARLWLLFEDNEVNVKRGELEAVPKNLTGARLAVSALGQPPAPQAKPQAKPRMTVHRIPKIYGGVRRPNWYR